MDFDYTFDTIEKILVKRSLTDKNYLCKVAPVFDKRMFSNKTLGVIMDIAIKYFNKYDSVPSNKTLTFLAKKYCEKNGLDIINEISSELISVNNLEIDVHDACSTKNLYNFIKKKLFYFQMSDAISDNKSKDLETSVEKHLEKFDQLMKLSFVDDDLGMMYFNKDDMDKHWDFIKNPDAKISTGWEGLDHHTHGGFLRDGKMLALFVGQAGLGKSLFLSNISVNFLMQNKSVVVISLEMSQNVYAQRFDSAISEDNINKLNRTSEESRRKIEEFYRKHEGANLIIKEYPPKTMRVVDIENYLQKLLDNGHHIDAIIIDYLNLLLPNVKQDNMYQSVQAVSEQLRALSYKFNAPVISATQAATSGMNNANINLQDISESRGQAHTADFVGMLFSSDEDKSHGIIRMRIAKNRFGAPGSVIPFGLNSSSLRLVDRTFADGSEDDPVSEADNITNNLSNISSDIDTL